MGQNLRILCCAVFLASSVFAAPAFSDPCDGDNCKLTSDGQWKSFNLMQFSWASCLDQSTGADITQCPAYVMGLTSPCYQIKVGNAGVASTSTFVPMGSAAEFNNFMHSGFAADQANALSFQACPNTGACGTANGQQFADLASLTAAQTCTTSAVAAPSGSGPWNWTCRSTVQGYPAVACSASAPGLPACVPDNTEITSVSASAPASVSCSAPLPPNATWSEPSCCSGLGIRRCTQSIGDPSQYFCKTNTAPVNGLCGTANGVAVITAPSTNLCATGTASSVAGVGPWTWSCNGSNGGSNDTSCQAARLALNSPPSCTTINGPSGGVDNQFHTLRCPANMAATSFSVMASNRLDGDAILNCCTLPTNYGLGTEVSHSPGLDVNADNQEHIGNCGPGEVLTGLQVYATNKWDGQLTVYCKSIAPAVTWNTVTTGATGSIGLTSYGTDNARHSAVCGMLNKFMSGISFWSTNQFDNIDRLWCTGPTGCGAANGMQFDDINTLAASGQLCTTSVVIQPTNTNDSTWPWTWTCKNSDQSSPDVSCFAAPTPPADNGVPF